MQVLSIVICLIMPLFSFWVIKRVKLLNSIGSIIICYVLGLIFAQLVGANQAWVQGAEMVSGISVFLAIPLLLSDNSWGKVLIVSRKFLLSTLLAFIVLLSIVYVGKHFFLGDNANGNKISALMLGVYTGGTPNLVSLKMALGVDANTYLKIHLSDTILGALYVFMLMFWAKKGKKQESDEEQINEDPKTKSPLLTIKSLGYTLLISVFSLGLSMLVFREINMPFVIVLITGASIVGALLLSKKGFKADADVGNYFLHVFSFAVAAMASLSDFDASTWLYFYYVAFVLFATFAAHMMCGYFLKVDKDILFVTSIALICSPPFVPLITRQLNRKDLLLPGLVIGVWGYVGGTFLGLMANQFLN